MKFLKSLAIFVVVSGLIPSVWGKNLREVSSTKDTSTNDPYSPATYESEPDGVGEDQPLDATAVDILVDFNSTSSDLAWMPSEAAERRLFIHDILKDAVQNLHKTTAKAATSDLTIDNGHWGNWRGWKGEKPPYYACGARMRYQNKQKGLRDDSAANGLKLLFCHWRDWRNQKWVTIDNGYWGDWKNEVKCATNKFIEGAEVRVERNRGYGTDDTGLNGMKIRCVDRNGNGAQTLTVHNGDWGDWKGMKTKKGWLVSYAEMRIEGRKGGITPDNTAWNGLKLRFSKRPAPTPRPTRSPTPRPTPRPTRRPTPRPTRRPTRGPTNRPTPRPSPGPTYAKRKGQSCNVNQPCEAGLGCDSYIGVCVKIPAGEGESCRQYACDPNLECARDTTATCVRPHMADPLKDATRRLDCQSKENVFCSPQLEKCYCLDPKFIGSYQAGALACKQSGGEIASILSKFENDSIMAKKDWWKTLKASGGDRDLRSRGAWIGLVERFGSDGLAWYTGEDLVYKTPLDTSRYSPAKEDIVNGCFVLTSDGKWRPERCNPRYKSEKASVLCQSRSSISKKLQAAFFDVFPKGLVFMLNYGDRTYITSDFRDRQIKADKLVSVRGKPGGGDRFKFIPDVSKSGVLIQVATWDRTKSPPVPVFDEENGVFITMQYKDNLSAEKDEFYEIPVLGDRAKATVFNIASRSYPNGPPFGLQVKYLPEVFLSVDALGQVRFKKCPNDVASCFTIDFVGAPDKYQLIVTLDEIDFAKHLEGGTTDFAVAAKREIETEVEGTITIELSSEQMEERSVTTTAEMMKEASQSATDTEGRDTSSETSQTNTEEESLEKSKTETTTETHEASGSISGGAWGVEVEASYSYTNEQSTETGKTETSTSTFEKGITETLSANWETSLEQSEGWSSTATDETGLVQTRTVTITDTLEVEAQPGVKYTAKLIVASKKIKNLVVPATSRLYADGIVVATWRISVTVDTVAVSSGSIKLEKVGEPIEEPARLEKIGSISEDENDWSRVAAAPESASSDSKSEEESRSTDSASSESASSESASSESEESESASSESVSVEDEVEPEKSESDDLLGEEDDFFAEDDLLGEEDDFFSEDDSLGEEDDFFKL